MLYPPHNQESRYSFPSDPLTMEKDHKPSNAELLSSAKLVADAAKSALNNKRDKVEKGKVAGAAADLLGAAQDYGKLDKNTDVGQYVEKAESYLHKYQTSHQSAPATEPETHATGDSEKGKGSAGGVGDYMKMAQGFFGK
ncbi:putative Nodulin-related protein 1 [Hibiscus syriacus]|uniref:Nodulin-related protein 1 n=1 Tax=Hibiscus syriacus TaxID=106335 RepID=A0A6A2XRP2_HIBSY|nr:nodulin-related protein 1-like [Hibiscus syriacus]KAE8678383.1 putative Nodulin-related protein 1 [Hibiscus syriacus]